MKVVILAGGAGSRLAADGVETAKPLVRIGERPILWHVLRIYAHFGHLEFVIALGRHGEAIRRAIDDGLLGPGPGAPAWRVRLVDTGMDTGTGGRLRRLAAELAEETSMLTWCDGLADVDLTALQRFHRTHGRIATVTAVHPPTRFGELRLDGDRVREMQEKGVARDRWINGAFFVLEPAVLERIDGDDTSFERDVLPALAADGELMAYRHESFWQCMDTGAERDRLERLWRSGRAPWKVW